MAWSISPGSQAAFGADVTTPVFDGGFYTQDVLVGGSTTPPTPVGTTLSLGTVTILTAGMSLEGYLVQVDHVIDVGTSVLSLDGVSDLLAGFASFTILPNEAISRAATGINFLENGFTPLETISRAATTISFVEDPFVPDEAISHAATTINYIENPFEPAEAISRASTVLNCWGCEDDGNPCTDDVCDPVLGCVHTNNNNPCDDADACTTGDTCSDGACAGGPPSDCDDGNDCTIDLCDPATGCVHSNEPDGSLCDDGDSDTCDDECAGGQCSGLPCGPDCPNGKCEPGEDSCNCPQDCGPPPADETDCSDGLDNDCDTWIDCMDPNCMDVLPDCPCDGERDLSDPQLCYLPEVQKTIHIGVSPSKGTSALGVEDTPPTGWTQIDNISDNGVYDAVNHEVKWGPFFPPFPTDLSYDITPPAGANGVQCFLGTVSIDGINTLVCGDHCVDECSPCPHIPADETQPACAGCTDCSCGTCEDGRVELCEMIGYACAWRSGCNDDLAFMVRAAFIWRDQECYCWDESALNWFPVACPAGDTCCAARGYRGEPAGGSGVAWTDEEAMVALEPFDEYEAGGGITLSITIDAPDATSAMGLEYFIPEDWEVSRASDEGEWDGVNSKIKWGPFFEDLSRTVTLMVRPLTDEASVQDFRGTVSFDGLNVAIDTRSAWKAGPLPMP